MADIGDALTLANAKTALAIGTTRISAGEARIDLSGLRAFDSSALAVLLAWRRTAESRRQTLSFSGVPAGLLSLARAYGVDTLLFTPDEQASRPA